jgi:hypothetical protein
MSRSNGNGQTALPEVVEIGGIQVDQRAVVAVLRKERNMLEQRIIRNALRKRLVQGMDANTFRSRVFRLKPGTSVQTYTAQLQAEIDQDRFMLERLGELEREYELAE